MTKDELSLFTESLERFDMEGQGIRVERPDYDYSRPKLSLYEAQTFLARRLLKQWLIKKREVYNLTTAQAQAENLSNKLNI